ncbi:IS1 family transposase [Citrobacter pasteurii]
MATIIVHCPRCQSALDYRHGQNPKGIDRFRCRECHRGFLPTYSSEARKESLALKSTLPMAFNGIGVRDTTGVLQIGINTVIHTLKNSRRNE